MAVCYQSLYVHFCYHWFTVCSCLTIEGKVRLFIVDILPVSLCYPHFSLQQSPSVLCKLADAVYFLILIDAFMQPCCALLCRFDGLCWIILLSCLFPLSHNTKTTSWMDPRCRDKASRPLEECDDDGKLLHHLHNKSVHLHFSVGISRRCVRSHTLCSSFLLSGDIVNFPAAYLQNTRFVMSPTFTIL